MLAHKHFYLMVSITLMTPPNPSKNDQPNERCIEKNCKI